MNRRKLVQCLACLAPWAALLPASANEVAYPSKPIRLIVASAPGALLDAATRLYAERMSAYLKQPVIVENVAGASSLLAVRQVTKAAPDGHTLLTAANTVVTLPHLTKSAGYTMKELAAVGEMARSPSLLVVGGSSPIKSIAELVALAKKSPGTLTYASGGQGTASHLPAVMFAKQADIALSHIPYKGIALAVPDVSTSRVGFMMGTATSVAELIKSGGLRPLAITSETRSPKFPDVPTFKELGYPGVTFDIWVGILAPAGLPGAVIAKLGSAMEAARSDTKVVKRLDDMGQLISSVRTPADFDAFVRDEEQKYQKLIKDANIVAD